MTSQQIDKNRQLFEDLKQVVDRVECWDARKLMPAVGYSNWREFEGAIDKAKIACETNGEPVENHFLGAAPNNTGTRGRPRSNYLLTRTACYYIFQNADPRKPEIAGAQAYFIRQTRRQEAQERLGLDMRRVFLHDRVASSTESLTQVATMNHNVTNPAAFHEAGNAGMYNMPVDEVEALKGIEPGKLMDSIDSPELAAHYFRITQTEISLANDAFDGHIYDQEGAEAVATSVGVSVRSSMRENGRTLPEDLPAVEDIEPVRKRVDDYAREQHQRIEPGTELKPVIAPSADGPKKQTELFG
jgi:DNA-damage-inducible protein D